MDDNILVWILVVALAIVLAELVRTFIIMAEMIF